MYMVADGVDKTDQTSWPDAAILGGAGADTGARVGSGATKSAMSARNARKTRAHLAAGWE